MNKRSFSFGTAALLSAITAFTTAPQIAAADTAVIVAEPGATASAEAEESADVNGVVTSVRRSSNKPKIKKQREGDDLAVEQRLKRLEQKLDQLAAHEKGPGAKKFTFENGKGPNVRHFEFNQKEVAKVHKDMERAAREMEKAAGKKHFDHADWGDDVFVEGGECLGGLNVQRKALEAQRKVLERQLQAITKRIEALENEGIVDEREVEIEVHPKHGPSDAPPAKNEPE